MSTWRSIVQQLTGLVDDSDGTTKSYPDVQLLSNVQPSMHLSLPQLQHVVHLKMIVRHKEVSPMDLPQVMEMVNHRYRQHLHCYYQYSEEQFDDDDDDDQ